VNLEFHYNVVLNSDESGQVTSLIAYQISTERPLRAVLWSVRRKQWIYAPEIAADVLFATHAMDRTHVIDQETAEQLAREVLQTELPDEAVLQEMCDEGERMGWRLGPPRE
jgi:hypothetical protein